MAPSLTPRAFARMFPNASRSTFAANFGADADPKAYAPRVPDSKPEPNQQKALDGVLPGEAESPKRARVCVNRFSRRLLDDDNAAAGCKPIVDCIKEAGLIVDDSRKWIDLVVDQTQVKDEAEERTEIQITWLPN